MRSLPSWAHTDKYCRDLGEKTQGSCSEDLPASAAISEALLASACVVYTNHMWLSQGMRVRSVSSAALPLAAGRQQAPLPSSPVYRVKACKQHIFTTNQYIYGTIENKQT